MSFPGGSTVKNQPVMQKIQVWSLGWEDPLEKEVYFPLQYSCLGNSMDRGAWWVTVRGSQRVRQDWVPLHAHMQVSWKVFPDLSGWGISASYKSPTYWVSFFLVPHTMAGVHVFIQLFNTSLDSLEAPQRQAWEWPLFTTVSIVSASRMGT